MPTVSLNSPALSPASPRATSPSSVRISTGPNTRPRPGWTGGAGGGAGGSASTAASPSRAVSSPRSAASPSSAAASPASAYATAASASTSLAGSPIARTGTNSASPGLLVPTDRAAEDLEENWLPRLGRLRVAGEVRVPGYALFGIRSWYLSRTHWSFTIATSTGKPTDQISCYVIEPAPELSDAAGAQELAVATRRLAGETQGQPRRTEFGTLLVSTPGGYRQEISPIQTGDMREAWPFIVLNTALRRLGCGGRAALGNEFPVPAVRRKFYELYRITMPKGEADSVGGASSPPASPVSGKAFDFLGLGHGHPSEQPSAETVASSPILLNTVELVKIIQAALAIWGMYGPGSDDTEVDGLFCDETKTGLFEWRRMMGMESEDGFKLAKETSGGCIDPRTLAALVSSITSVRYQLAVLGVEKLPKDPFSSPRKFITVWRAYMAATDPKNTSKFLSVSGIRALNSCYVSGRSKSHPTDALKVHRFLLSGVASATSSISANLKGSSADDSSTPLRKREQHKRFGGDADDSGLGMIVPEGNGNTVAAPDVITTDLGAYRKLLEKSRERDWDTMGARRVAELWSGVTAERGPERDGARHHGRLAAFRRRVTQNVGDDEDGAGAIGAFKGMRDRTGAAIKGGFGLVGRRHATTGSAAGANYDTSDSEGPSRSRRKPYQSVPLVVEPEDDTGERDRLAASYSRSPSPTPYRDTMPPQTPTLRTQTRSTYPAIQSPLQHSVHLSSYSGEFSDGSVSRGATTSPFDQRRSFTHSAASHDWATILPPTSPHMLRTRSDPPSSEKAWDVPVPVRRSKSFTYADEYRDLRRRTTAPLDEQVHHLIIDVAMCGLVWELRDRERALAKRAADMQTLERSALAASQAIFDARDTRLAQLTNLEREAATLVDEIHVAGATGVEDDVNLHRAANNVQFYLSEDTNTNELVWGLQDLQKAWEGIRDEPRAEPADAPRPRPWWQW